MILLTAPLWVYLFVWFIVYIAERKPNKKRSGKGVEIHVKDLPESNDKIKLVGVYSHASHPRYQAVVYFYDIQHTMSVWADTKDGLRQELTKVFTN